jgi:serine/threonine-protein kinase RsbW
LRFEIEREAHAENLQGIRDFIETACRRAGVERSAAFDLKLAVDEACSNILEHGYTGRRPGPIRIRFDAEGDQVVVTITDRGRAFDPKDAAIPDLDADWEHRRVGGLGWHLIRRSVDSVAYESDPNVGNRLTLVKTTPLAKASTGAE